MDNLDSRLKIKELISTLTIKTFQFSCMHKFNRENRLQFANFKSELQYCYKLNKYTFKIFPPIKSAKFQSYLPIFAHICMCTKETEHIHMSACMDICRGILASAKIYTWLEKETDLHQISQIPIAF